MAFDTFDEGISLGGMRSKTEIRTLICYMYKSVGSPMSKETIINALMEKGLANYFEVSATTSCATATSSLSTARRACTSTPRTEI